MFEIHPILLYTYPLCRVLMEQMAYLGKQVPLEVQERMGGQVDLDQVDQQ